MPTGTVKWFDSKKGFGFIIGPEGKDVFVHFTRIEGDGFRSLRDGEQVEYEHTQGEKGTARDQREAAGRARRRDQRKRRTCARRIGRRRDAGVLAGA